MNTWNHGPVEDYAELNRASWDERAPAHAASPRLRGRPVRQRPRRTSARWCGSTCRCSATSAGCAAFTCSATSAPTPSRWPASARDMTGLDFSPPRWRRRARLAGRGRRRRRVRRGRRLRRGRRARPGAVRPGVHRDRRAVLAAGHPPLGAGRGRPAAPGRAAVHPRGPPDAVGARRRPRPTACWRSSTRTSSARSRSVCDEGGTYVETDVVFTHNRTHEWNHGLGEIVTALLERRDGPDRARRARQRAVGRPARPDGARSGAASGGWPTARGGCPTPTRCRPSSAPESGQGATAHLMRRPISFVL